MSGPYPYPQLDVDGYELEIVEQEDAPVHGFLRYPIPDDEARFAAEPGDLVKLIFRYRDYVEKDGQTIAAEHMWVRVIDYGEGHLIGRLDNDPQFTAILKSDDEIHFHPKHIVRFWRSDTEAV
jgi:hypothetical protein